MQGNPSLARRLLEEVIANTPQDYVYSYEEGDQLFIKFWDKDEFVQYVTDPSNREGKSIVWILNAYPRAYYYLACIDVEEGKYESALAYLEASLNLEPGQPLCLCEMALVYGAMAKRELAIDFYDKALQSRPYITAKTRALALRGKAIQLIELGQLDLAETCLKESLLYDPSSKVALNELMYIASIRSGGNTLPSVIKRSEKSQDVCAICGKELVPQAGKELRVVNINGRVLYMCSECSKRRSKRWWQFWK